MAKKQKIKRERGSNWEPKIRYRKDRGTWMVDLGTKFTPRKLYFATEAEATKIADVSDEYVDSKVTSGKRHRTIGDTRFKLKPFVEAFGSKSISEITTADVEGWLNLQDYVASTRNACRRAVFGLFTHAVKRRYIEFNPVAAIESVTVDQGLPAIHTPAQVKAMLRAAFNFIPSHKVVVARDMNRKVTDSKDRPVTDPAKIHQVRSLIVPYLAIGYFAGLRPENELANLDWKDVDFSAKTIRVSPATAKKRRQRYVDMSDNLIQWLAPYVKIAGKQPIRGPSSPHSIQSDSLDLSGW